MKIIESIDVNLTQAEVGEFITTKEARLYITHYIIRTKSGSSFYRHFYSIGSLPVIFSANKIRIPTKEEDTTLVITGPCSMEIKESKAQLKWDKDGISYSVGLEAVELKSNKPVLIVDLI